MREAGGEPFRLVSARGAAGRGGGRGCCPNRARGPRGGGRGAFGPPRALLHASVALRQQRDPSRARRGRRPDIAPQCVPWHRKLSAQPDGRHAAPGLGLAEGVQWRGRADGHLAPDAALRPRRTLASDWESPRGAFRPHAGRPHDTCGSLVCACRWLTRGRFAPLGLTTSHDGRSHVALPRIYPKCYRKDAPSNA